jgi:hypothetical protein
LRHFATKDKQHQSTPWAEFYQGACLLAGSEEAVEDIPHPVVRSVVNDFCRMTRIVEKAGPPHVEFVERLFFDVCAVRLGIKASVEPKCPDVYAEHASLLSKVADVLGAKVKKACEGRLSIEALARLGCFPAEVASSPVAVPPVTGTGGGGEGKVLEESGQGTQAGKDDGATKDKDDGATKDKGHDESKDAAAFEVGEEVVLTVAKFKEQYNGKRAKITKILSQKIRVQLLEGPAEGEEKDFAKTACARAEVVLVAPAGAKRGIAGESAENPAAKAPRKEQGEALAASLFGDVSGM